MLIHLVTDIIHIQLIIVSGRIELINVDLSMIKLEINSLNPMLKGKSADMWWSCEASH